MGYSERYCQICGVGFNIGRLRKGDEPESAAWAGYGSDFCVNTDCSDPCKADGCSDIARQSSDTDHLEHIAAPGCTLASGYSGWRITVEEIENTLRCQCLAAKLEDWAPEPGDSDFEVEAKHCFLTGISSTSPDEFDVHGLVPVRHGIGETMIENTTQGDMQDDEQMALPMHPICFQLFQRVSRSKLGKVEIDGLWRLREAQGHYSNRFKDFPESPDLTAVSEQWYDCVPGTEYLTSNPLQVQGLSELIETCERDTNQVSDVVLDPGRDFSHVDDVLAILSPELRHLLLHHLGRRDVANLRLASSSFRQLPQVYFHRIVETKMPWVWELDNFKGRRMDWYTLWRKLSAANGGAGIDEQERNWRRQVPLQKYAKARETLGANDRMDGRECRREADAEIKAGYEAGMWPPRASDAMQLRGLRNRRRSLEDLQEIFRRIAALPPDDDSEELE